MHKPHAGSGRKRCHIPDCRTPAAFAFLAITGDHAARLLDHTGRRIRTCHPHMHHIAALVRALPDPPDRLRAVPLTATSQSGIVVVASPPRAQDGSGSIP